MKVTPTMSGGSAQLVSSVLLNAKGIDTDMEITEALNTVLTLARRMEYTNEFDWEDEHREACSVVSLLIDEYESGADADA